MKLDIPIIKKNIISTTIQKLQNYVDDNPNLRKFIDFLNPDMKDFKQIGTTSSYKTGIQNVDTKLRVQHKIDSNIDKLKK